MVEISEQSSSSSLTYNYDVFLSFRGIDTRHNFTDHLYNALVDADINTFLDDEEIDTGKPLKPELESAIKSSQASIIVLSKRYATSTWCLDELALILEQQKSFNQTVIPIFYHVEPTHVRKQTSTFGEAMAEHTRKMEVEKDEERRCQLAQKIESWKRALKEVADLKGKDANGRPETEFITEIVNEIRRRLQLDKRRNLPDVFGMESSIRMITSFLNERFQQISAEVLTIWGMPGIGKTHLANHVFQLHKLDFDRSCFLEDIERESIKENGLIGLQKALLKDIQAKGRTDIRNLSEGTLKIEDLLLRKRTLLVLDGINRFEQLDVLIGTKGLHPGSKVIITSKNALVTEKCKLFETQVPPKHTKHWLQGLNDEESLQLLCWHAFASNYEPNESDKIKSMKVVKYCQGHPLALKVLGSCLRSGDDTWDDILESLGNEIKLDIEKVLKISFDTLPSVKDKELFKHIACLFVGEDRKCTEDILKACGVCKSSGVQTLINRCLLTIKNPDDKLMMHQLLQDLGRDIVRQESPTKPWERSLLWHHEECLDVLQNKEGTTSIQGLSLDMRKFENETWKEPSSANMQKYVFRSLPSFSGIMDILLSVIWMLFGWLLGMRSSSRKTKGDFDTLALSEMRKLRLLRLNYVQLSGSYKNFPEGLRWLCMHGFPLSYIPSDLPMKNMVALDMSNSKLKQLWNKPKLWSLKFLNLSSCHELVRVGHFSGLPQLERLTLVGCTSLVEVCESIGNYCHELKVIDLTECSKLKELPRSIGKLQNLTHLLICGCSNLTEFPIEMKDMESLEVLKADNINMKSFGSSSSAMVLRSSKSFVSSLPRSLVTLSLMYCNLKNESFPTDYSSLSMLKELNLDGNPIDSMPECVRILNKLEILTFTWCDNLKTVLCAPILLKYLGIEGCNSLKKITFHPKKLALPEYIYFDSINVSEIQYKFKMQDLSEVNEEILRGLGWNNVEYLKRCQFSIADCHGYYYHTEKTIPMQMLYEHGIFSTYLHGQEVPKWFTHRSSESLFTLRSSPKYGKIQGINVCIVHTISSINEAGPSRIEIRNMTKNSSWTYEPMMYYLPEDGAFKDGGKVVVVWLSHWMFGNNEFEDGDQVSINFSVKYCYLVEGRFYMCYDSEGLDYANVREYGISLVYEDDDSVGEKRKKDPLDDYKSWKHIIGKDLSAFKVPSSDIGKDLSAYEVPSSDHYLLTPSSNDESQEEHPYEKHR